MAFRFNVIAILVLLATGTVLSMKQSGSTRSKKKPSPPKLSANIDENPFLKDHFTTTTTTASIPAVDYERNPFLSFPNRNQGQFGNGTENHPNIDSHAAEENGDVTVAIYIHNPFLQHPCNTPGCNAPVTTVSSNGPNINNGNSGVVKLPPISVSTRTTSEIKCEEYSRQISGTTEVLPLVGGNPDVIKVDNARCGGTNHLVVGGTDARPGEFPHMVALGKNVPGASFIFYCGGTLISPEWVLTAAHCTYGPNGSPTVARIGFYNLREEQHGSSIGINRILRHPNYKPPAMYADIALIKLETVVRFSSVVRPACLYQQYDTVPTQAWVSGWGVTEFGGDQSDKLQKAFLNVIDNIACTIMYNRSTSVPHGITPSMICAGDPQGGWNKDTCQGDSGGPLQVIHPNNICLFQIIGVTSFGEGCAIVDKPGVYTRVSHYLDWIEDIVWSES